MLHLQFRSLRSRVAAGLIAVCVSMGQCVPVWGQSAGDASLPQNLNLGTARRTAVAPESLTSPVTIVSGGTQREVSAGDRLTPAQALAVMQMMQNGTQSIILGERGRAIGGSVDLTGVQNIASLKVPTGVTVLRDFGVAPPLELSGNLVNSGAIYALSTNAAVTNAIVSADNIRNNVGALISSILPAGGLPGVTDAISNLSLSLIAKDSIFNFGNITSAGNLNLVAGNQIVNGAPGSASILSALGNVNIATQSLVNSALVQASSNINVVEQVIRNAELAALSTQLTQSQGAFDVLGEARNLAVNNLGGVLQALNGTITFDNANAPKATLMIVVGGDLLSQEVTVDAGAGSLFFNVNQLTGPLNISAGTAWAGSVSDLTLGSITILGDPVFFSTGNITTGL